MDVGDLKQYIIDNDKIDYILEKLECKNIKEYTTEYRASDKSSTSGNRNIAIKKDGLSVSYYTSENTVRGDVVTLTMTLKNINFIQSLKWLHTIMDLKFDKKYTASIKKKDISEIFKKTKRYKGKFDVDEINRVTINDLNYQPYLYIDWIKEGIIERARRKFSVGYDYVKKAIIIPHRYALGDPNEFIGIMSRTTNPLWKELGIPKYYPLKPYPKSINLYGYQENYQNIISAGFVVVYEAEKSVLKRCSRLDDTGVALMCHDISDEQVKLLCGLNVEIIISLDTDIPLQQTRRLCEKFYGKRKVSYMYDKYGVLPDKSSVADANNKTWNWFFKNRIAYDEKEHIKFIEERR